MPQINQLPLLDTVSPGDNLVVYAPSQGDARRLPISELLAYFQSQFATGEYFVQFETPVTGFSINVSSTNGDIWLIMQPVGALAAGTIVLPANTSLIDGQEVLVTTTQQITSLTVSDGGAIAVYGAPGSMAAETSFRLRYYAAADSWYKIS